MIPKILAVDDSKTIRAIIEKMLSEYKCELIKAADGQEGLTLSKNKRPDLILLDIDMPRMNGLELLKHLRNDRELANTPVFMLTSKSSSKNVQIAVRLGVAAYIAKPFSRDKLIEKIQKVLPLEPI